ncbi:CBS and ACT domain-containing protein [Salisediminibacterium selenitireducens]|uniref:CBS domain containing membrane protein n=1 Tax=Bacillus selenitireducens (strain ATCC 700615 / DSM 15326 / MLS10) TaxID=439292 RepID=D6XSK4_BACIE|nr:CBS and ACT domain-containing protein [Salisediminibacterium selenitireducens]ADH98790.1 CBS domain containing membrane protein [[Bacillus] selenitireducens MLS10]
MNVSDIMVKDVITAKADMAAGDALEFMKHKHIRHLPIVDDDGQFIGIVSDRDLKDAAPSIFEKAHDDFIHVPVSKVMITDVITALPLDFVEEAAYTMVEHQISCLPVEDDGRLVGIITETDLLNVLVKLTGAALPSSRLEIEVSNESGNLCMVTQLIRDQGMNIQSVLLYPSHRDDTKKVLVFRIQAMDMRPLLDRLKNAGYNVKWPQDLEMGI